MVRRWNVCRSRTGSLAHGIMISMQAIRMPAPITRRGGSMALIGASPRPCPPTDRGYKCEAIADARRSGIRTARPRSTGASVRSTSRKLNEDNLSH